MGKAWKPRKFLPKRLRKPVEPMDPLRPLLPGGICYALGVSPHKAHHVAKWLESQYRCHTIIPLETRYRLARGNTKRGGKRPKREAFQEPLFPRLCFVVFYDEPRWLEIDRYQHVTGVVTINGVPAPLRADEPEGLRLLSERLKKHADPKALQIGKKAIVVKPGILLGKTIEIKTLRGRSAIVKGWCEADVDREASISTDDLEAA